MQFSSIFTFALLLAGLLLDPHTAPAVETVRLNQQTGPEQLVGQVLVEDSAGSLMLETDEGAMHTIMANMIRSRQSDTKPFERLDKDGLAERLLAEMGPGFQVYQSKHYVVVYNTTLKYAQWSSSLLERLQRGFLAYWKKRGCDVKEPEFPLAVVVLGDKESYLRYAKEELGPAAGSAIGYYSLKTNRITMYDLTGMQALRREDTKRGSSHDISAMLSEPEAVPLVATIVHEATHQIAFNCGMQKRFGTTPVWLGEGLAMYHETPDLGSSRSWSGIGNVNYSRFDLFHDNYDAGKIIPLERMLTDDKLFQTPETAVDSYAQAWAWNYFLIRSRPKEYAAYMKTIAAKPVLVEDKKGQRVKEFRAAFGDDLKSLEDDFYRMMNRVK